MICDPAAWVYKDTQGLDVWPLRTGRGSKGRPSYAIPRSGTFLSQDASRQEVALVTVAKDHAF